MSTVVQPCARCGTRWAVQGTPMHWCPRCRGVLLSPSPIDAPPERRNYRWVARRPGRLSRPAHAPGSAPGVAATPRYAEMPRWGLRDQPPRTAGHDERGRWWTRLPDWSHALLFATAVLFGLAALAELGRYLILLVNRTTLIDPLLLGFSDALVNTAALFALAVALLAGVGVFGRLVELRRVTYAERGSRDPRSVRMLALGCLFPVVNMIWPGVFLIEAVRDHPNPRVLRMARIWWAAWVVNAVLVIVALLWRTADSLQAEADGVMFTAVTDLAAAGMAVLTLWMLRAVEGRDLLGRRRLARRWVIAVDPGTPLIAPVHPGTPATVSTVKEAPENPPAETSAATADDPSTGAAVDDPGGVASREVVNQ